MKAHLMINELFQPIKRALKLQGHAHACERARMAMLREKSRLAEQVRRSGIQKVKGKKEKSNSKKPVPLSKRIRDIVRLLKRPNLEEAVRAAQEKRLIALREEWESRKRAAIERKFAIRYHKVRFFERVKLERQLNKLQRSLASAAVRNDETKSIESRIQQVKEDLEYVLHFPKGEKYVSIIKDADDPEAQEHLEKERQRLREIIRKHLAEEALVAEPDEGRGLDQINDIATEEVEGSEDDFFLNDTDDGKAEDGKALPVLAAPSQPQRGPLSMKNDDHTPARPVKKARANSHVKVPAHRNKYDAQHDRRFLASKKHVPTKSRKVMDTSAKPLSDGPTRRTRAQGGRKRRK